MSERPETTRPLRILILHSRYSSGPVSGENRVVEDETRLLREAGHSVSVWSPSAAELRGVRRAALGFRATWSSDAVREVRRRIRATRAEVVHCHNLFPMLSPAAVSTALDDGCTAVVTLHNYRLLCLPATFLRDGRVCELCLGRLPWRGAVHRCYRDSAAASASLAASLVVHRALRTFERPILYLAVSSFVREKHLAAGFPESRVLVKPNFAWPAPPREGPGDYFLYLGRLSREKGISTAIEAWRGMPARLLVAGNGPDCERLRASAARSVEFRGLVSPGEVPGLLANARALLLPTRSYEGAPRTVAEAYASGVPVLASRLGSLPELVDHGRTGYLLPAGDAAAWRTAAERLLDDDESARLGENARELWRTRFSPEQGLLLLEDAYRRALDGAAPRGARLPQRTAST